jgi:hypothetical protein
VRKDWKVWTVHINAHHVNNWALGIDYYHVNDYQPLRMLARVLQINLLFFNITFTRWQANGWI